MNKRPGPSLKARAVDYLSRREHSRPELTRKLARYADNAEEVENVLAELERHGLLSNERFADSLVHRRKNKLGAARIVQELRQHGVDSDHIEQLRTDLKETEFERAYAVWQKRFGESATEPALRAKQQRFLAQRGFSGDVIRRVTGGEAPDDDFNL